jgi:hypothetical protein
MIGYHHLDGLGVLDQLQSFRAAAGGQNLVVDPDRFLENIQDEGIVIYAKQSRSWVGSRSHNSLSCHSAWPGARGRAATAVDRLSGYSIHSSHFSKKAVLHGVGRGATILSYLGRAQKSGP